MILRTWLKLTPFRVTPNLSYLAKAALLAFFISWFAQAEPYVLPPPALLHFVAAPQASSSASAPAEKDQLELEKLRVEIANLQRSTQNKDQLESEKLALEVQQLKHWWLEPSFFQAAFGSLVALGALLTGYYNGWFEVQRGKLEIANAKLEDKRSELNSKIFDLDHQRSELIDKVSALADDGAQLAARLKTTLMELETERKARTETRTLLAEARLATDQIITESITLNHKVALSDPKLREEVRSLDDRWKSLRPLQWNFGPPGPETTPGASFYNEFNKPVFDYDENISAEALFKANATPAMLDIYNQLPLDLRREMEVRAVLDHLTVVNKLAANEINWGKERLAALGRNIV